jgi:acetylglutamate kinase
MLTQGLQNQQVPLIVAQREAVFERIGKLAQRLNTKKLVVLRRKGGLGPHGSHMLDLAPGHFLPTHAAGISVINLRADLQKLLASGALSAPDAKLLSEIRTVLEHAQSSSTTLSVTSPLSLLSELFTVKGAGTLVKLGSPIERHQSYAELDRSRLTALLQSSFKRSLSARFFDSPLKAIYLEANYRGAAILQPGDNGAFLSKFAVDPLAQGEGIGHDLWRAMLRDTPKFYWRARPENPILSWYKSVCDGFTHHAGWSIFWRGYTPEELSPLVGDATQRPIDFEM